MKVYLIGAGMGNPQTMTAEALEAIRACPLLVGAPRLLEPWADSHTCVPLIVGAQIAAYITHQPLEPVGYCCQEIPAFTAEPSSCGSF